jgi:glycosyltransferase involved in cell wall biosynthesis
LIRGETGLVAKGNDEESLLKNIAYILDRPDRIKEMGQAARTYAEGRSFEKAFEETWNLYRESGSAPDLGFSFAPVPFPVNESSMGRT